MPTSDLFTASSAVTPVPGVSAEVQREAERYRAAFVSAQPFKHVMIENFFEHKFAEELLEEFPTFDKKLAINEMGEVGGKAVNPKIREISPAYKKLYDIIGGKPFLELVSRLSGIPDLILDPKLFGGGTHENLHGQDLDPHVDFNYDEAQKLHRRLNLIVYMNKEWQMEWGGAIEIHSNPRDPENNHIKAYNPSFNRAVMFETNEISWHGFPRIELPPDKRHLSRKSISIYLYTTTRPAEEIAPMHGTFYVQRPLPERLKPGYALSENDVHELKDLLIRRDKWIELYHRMELEKNREIATLGQAVQNLEKHVPVPVTGYVTVLGNPAGIFPDRWVSSNAEVQLQPLAPVSGVLIRGWRPPGAPEADVRVTAAGSSAQATVEGEWFEIPLRFRAAASDPFTVRIETQCDHRLVDASVDNRDLKFSLAELRVKHSPSRQLQALLED